LDYKFKAVKRTMPTRPVLVKRRKQRQSQEEQNHRQERRKKAPRGDGGWNE